MKPDDVIERLSALERFGIKLGLENIGKLTAALGSPQYAYPTLHVAGTNGKGSVTAIAERALRAAGYRTGRYTSPHLNRIEERIAIDGEPVSEGAFRDAAATVLDAIGRLDADGTLVATPTFFETTTAMAFEIFRRAGVEAAVIEVGLGGRFDATNVVAPVAAAITSIALDHEQRLGSSLASIAAQKAGIIKRGVPIVVGEMDPEPRAVIEATAAREQGVLVAAGLELVREISMQDGRATISIVSPVRTYQSVRLGLSGRHQVANAVVAVRLLEEAAAEGLRVAADDIVCGLTDVFWPARLEWLQLADGRRLLVDAAHNPAGAEALAAYLHDLGCGRVPIVLAAMQDKDIDAIARALLPVASRFVATSVALERALGAPELARRIGEIAAAADVEAVADPDRAVAAALARSPHAVATGSFFFVGPLRTRLIAAGAVSCQG